MLWWYLAGWGVFCSIGFFLLSLRRKYRDPSAAQNYETIRNKVTLRKIQPTKEKEQTSSERGPFIGTLIGGFIVILIGVSLIKPITEQVNTAQGILNSTQDRQVTAFTSSILESIPYLFSISILLVVISITFSMLNNAGMVQYQK